MCVAAISGLATIILCSYNLYVTTAATQVLPWRGWADTHSDYRRVEQFPAMIWHLIPGKVLALELTRWLAVFAAFIFFAFFGFAEEARKNYSSAAQSIGKHVGISSTESTWLGPSMYVQLLTFWRSYHLTILVQIKVWHDVDGSFYDLAGLQQTKSHYQQIRHS